MDTAQQSMWDEREGSVERNVAERESEERAKCADPATAPVDILLFSLHVTRINRSYLRASVGTEGARSAAAPQFWGLKDGWGVEIQRFSSFKRQYLENDSRYSQSYY